MNLQTVASIENPRSARISAWRNLPLLVILLLSLCTWVPTAMHIGWVSDDNMQVYGLPLRPMPTFDQAIRDAGLGKELASPSVVRILGLLICGYGGWALGTIGTHLLLGLVHTLCTLTLYSLLRRLDWEISDACWAAAIFAVSPWVSQSIFWWDGYSYSTITLIVLALAHAYIRWSNSGGRAYGSLAVCLIGLFIINCMVELWLAVFLFYWAIEVYLRCIRPERPRLSFKLVFSSLRTCWPVLIPTFLWIVLAKLTYHNPERGPRLPLRRVPVVLLSVHLRVYNWFVGIPWRTAVRDGAKALVTTPEGIVILILTALATFLLWRQAWARASSGSTTPHPPRSAIPLAPALLLAWGCYLGGRLVMTLLGGIDLHTRHNYGGAVGLAIAAAALLNWFVRNAGPVARRLGVGAAAMVLVLCMLATAGAGVHYRETARYEQRTVEKLAPAILALPAGTTVVVVGDPTGSPGELSYFSEHGGFWLDARLKPTRGDLHYFVARTGVKAGDEIRFAAIDPNDKEWLDVPQGSLALFVWSQDQLKPMQPEQYLRSVAQP